MELITLVRLNVAEPNKSKINNFFFFKLQRNVWLVLDLFRLPSHASVLTLNNEMTSQRHASIISLKVLLGLFKALAIWTSKQVWLLDFESYRSNFDTFFLGHEVGQWRNEKVYSNGKQILIIYNSAMHYPARPPLISPEKIAEMQKLYETFADDVY